MRLIRSAGQNVSPSDDGRLYDQIFADGLFEDATFANLGQNNVAVSEIYGIICGRDFTCEAQTIQVTLPEEESTVTGYIYLEVNTAAENVFTINSALAPFTPTYEDINVSGTICQMVLATYTATQLQIESITPQYVLASAGAVGSLASIESSPAKSNHAKNTFLVYNGVLYKARTAIAAGEDLVVGTNITRAYVGTELTSLKSDITSLNNDLTTVSNTIAFASSPTVASLSAFTSYVDGLFGTGNGYKIGYLTASSSVAAGLPSGGHYLIMISNSTNNRLVTAIYANGGRISTLTKNSGSWASEWKSVTLS